MCWPTGCSWLTPGSTPDVAGMERSGAEAGGVSQVHTDRLGRVPGSQEHVKAGWQRASNGFSEQRSLSLMWKKVGPYEFCFPAEARAAGAAKTVAVFFRFLSSLPAVIFNRHTGRNLSPGIAAYLLLAVFLLESLVTGWWPPFL